MHLLKGFGAEILSALTGAAYAVLATSSLGSKVAVRCRSSAGNASVSATLWAFRWWRICASTLILQHLHQLGPPLNSNRLLGRSQGLASNVLWLESSTAAQVASCFLTNPAHGAKPGWSVAPTDGSSSSPERSAGAGNTANPPPQC